MEEYFEFCLACYKYPDLIGLVELNYVIAGLFAHGTRREFLTLAQTWTEIVVSSVIYLISEDPQFPRVKS